MEKKCRVFIASFIDSKKINRDENVKKYKQQLNGSLKNIPDSQIHLTWKFLGDTEENRLEKIEKCIQNCIIETAASPRMTLEKLEIWPNRKNPKILALTGRDKNLSCEGLFLNLEKELIQEEFQAENRKFVPHITISRLKRNLESQATKLIKAMPDCELNKSINITFSEICLVKSILSSEGSKYEILSKFQTGIIQKKTAIMTLED